MKKMVIRALCFVPCVLCLLLGAGAAALPAGYTQIEYIESTKYVGQNGQYIDTEYTANANTKVVMDAYIPPREEQSDSWCVLFGSRTLDDWANKSFSIQLADMSNIRFAYNGENVDGSAISFGERMTITCDKQEVEWTGSQPGSQAVTVSPLAQSKSTLYIFGDNTVAQDGEKCNFSYNASVMRLYSFRIYEGEELKRDFVPCVETATGEAGLYDTVERKFYENKGDGAFGIPGTNYYDPVSKTTKVAEAIAVTESTETFEDGKWYVVKGNVERDTITVNGSANLILADGAKLTVDEGRYRYVGIAVANGNALTIWGQSNGTGELVANAGVGGAGIGSSYGACGAVTINGGTVTARGDNGGAGIGGGLEGAGGTVTINGGIVTATGAAGGAGIGGGNNGAGGTVTINGGTVTATGSNTDGIGSGRSGFSKGTNWHGDDQRRQCQVAYSTLSEKRGESRSPLRDGEVPRF